MLRYIFSFRLIKSHQHSKNAECSKEESKEERKGCYPSLVSNQEPSDDMSDALGDLQIVVIITENHAMQTILEPVKNHAIAKSAMYVKGLIHNRGDT